MHTSTQQGARQVISQFTTRVEESLLKKDPDDDSNVVHMLDCFYGELVFDRVVHIKRIELKQTVLANARLFLRWIHINFHWKYLILSFQAYRSCQPVR